MNNLTQHIIQKGIPEDIFILILAIPIIFVVILFARRIIGLRTFGLYTPLALIILLTVMGIKYGAILFALIFISMMIIRYFLRKIALLSMTDTRMLDALTFCALLLIILFAILYIPLFKETPFNAITLLTILLMGSYSESLLLVWGIKGFKRFISPAIESLGLIAVSYFLINWALIKNAILEYPLGIILLSIIIIILLAKWRGLKIIEYIRFKEIIKHAEPPKKR